MADHQAPSEAHQRLDTLQILRALAALAVLVHHAMQQANGATRPIAPSWMVTSGAAGVDIFFVISGFIMAWIAFRRPAEVPTPRRFLIDRLTRIIPLYWSCCIAVLAIAAAGFLRSVDVSPASVAASLALVPHANRLLGVAWTLEYELYFYLVFAMWLPLRRTGPCLFATGATILMTVIAAPFLPEGQARHFLGEPIMLEFLGGMALGWLALRKSGTPHVPPVAALAAWAALLFAPWLFPPETTDGLRGWTRVIAWGLPAIVIVAQALHSTGETRTSPLRTFIVRVGDASYALYLSHGFLMIGYAVALKRTGLGQIPQAPVVALLVACSVIIALAVHRFVERPLTAVVRRVLLLGRQNSPSAITAQSASN